MMVRMAGSIGAEGAAGAPSSRVGRWSCVVLVLAGEHQKKITVTVMMVSFFWHWRIG